MITTLRRSTIALLASSLLLTIGRGATLPFMTIYLTRRYQLEVDVIGYALSLALVVGVLFSMGFGILADKFDKKRYMVWSVLVFILGFSAIPVVHNATLVVIFFALINCAYSVFSTVLKAWFADRLTAEKKARIFSLNYTILNIGWTVGPPIGTLLVMHSINLPFWLAAACAAFPLVFIQLFLQRDGAAAAQPGAAAWTPSVLLRDRALLWFTCSGLLASFVGGAFASCISQYVLVVASSDFAEKVVAVVLPVNAAVVVALQYAVGRRLSARNIRPLMTFGTVCFVIGLVGFMFSGASLWAWGISAAIFTLGEVIYAPGEYMLIDHIAPPGMKASYFSAQSLGWLGAAFNPMFTGLILTHLPHWSLFVILIVAIVAAWLMIFRGMNARPWQPDSPLARA
ncbi:TPA: efflux MFS transporter YdeE [Klebsiella quasipneumoniae subsp. quasipneumoniae]|uniref:efflux MFS transporter YdeE n=1 Tax=Klebsiella quasipneumoniae TaxID=1463165 RepID=UPI000650CC37|nr:efflux MFS transporter YdeE [Klebsiella quasipneumoniae]KMH16094.1 major facilitator superfamily transporter [Klebsiella quasipneumoniae subsp. quasipneumoniae]QRZ78218.1 efflux MFS transporter YdeE [Klebsiella quasipneumoniae]VGD95518.1 putative MFS-type transporter YdeE [Klebsiella quasipneumoniae]VGE87443.1 putative MFS-type transporter YdeE [Klebsiella quasipneumoniae]HCI6217283.1 efflux MFS transporter YdeE [Klebsiella quasipneumoniae subsp. quasipneumoniae]